MSSAAAAGAGSGNEPKVETKNTNKNTNTKNNNSNNNNTNNNNNDKDYTVDVSLSMRPEVFITLPPENKKYCRSVITNVVENFFGLNKKEFKTLADVQSMLRDYISVFFAVEGHPPPAQPIESVEYERFVYSGVCTYLGTEGHSQKGCKVGDSKKLEDFTNYMSKKLIQIVQKIPDELKKEMVSDKTTMTIFEAAIRDHLYFYSQKQEGWILIPSYPKNRFVSLYTQINDLFKEFVDGRDLIQVYCPQLNTSEKKYSCGRYCMLATCVTSKKYFIVIGSIEGEYSDDVSPATFNYVTIKAKACGGRRRTRSKARRKTKKLKTRKH